MDLWCSESSDLEPQDDDIVRADCLRASHDKAILENSAVLERLLQTESQYIPQSPQTTYKCVQKEVKLHMRKILSTWMMEVSEEMGCGDVTFPLAMNYVDRFLSTTSINKEQLQLLGAVCLLIASKLRQCKSFHPEALVFYSDYSLSVADITAWEMLVLTRLKWDMSAVVPTDFLDHLLTRLALICDASRDSTSQTTTPAPGSESQSQSLPDTLRRHAATFVALCSNESAFSTRKPSLVATACVAAAAHGLHWSAKPFQSLGELLKSLQEVTGIAQAEIQSCLEEVEQVIAANNAILLPAKALPLTTNGCLQNGAEPMPLKACPKSKAVIASAGQPETPTDVQDIHF